MNIKESTSSGYDVCERKDSLPTVSSPCDLEEELWTENDAVFNEGVIEASDSEVVCDPIE